MQTITLSPESVKAVAREVARLLTMQQTPELVDCKTAATILGIKPSTLRKYANRYPHKREGGEKQARYYFYKEGLK
jgi:hypothetical protein